MTAHATADEAWAPRDGAKGGIAILRGEHLTRPGQQAP